MKEITLTENEFDEQYTPVKNHIAENSAYEGCMFETYGKELDYIVQMAIKPETSKFIWTILDGDDGYMYIVSGFHYINRLGYLITEEPTPENTSIEIKIN